MANQKVTRGMKAILLGDIAADGDVASSFPYTLGFVERASSNITQADDEVQEVTAEQSDTPIDVSYTEGAKTFTARLNKPDVDMLQYFFGGTITGSDPNRVWKKARNKVIIEKSVRIVPMQGMYTTYTRVSLSAKIDYPIGRAGTMGIILTGRILEPEKEGVPSEFIGNPLIV